MDEQDIREHRYRFFSEKGVQIAFEQDKLLVTLFTGVLAAVVALVVKEQLGFITTLCFLLTGFSALIGLASCLMHLAFSAKVMALFAAQFVGEEDVPNLIAREEPTAQALAKNRAFAQLCYSGQLLCLFWAAFFATLGVVGIAWGAVGPVGVVVTAAFATALSVGIFWPLIWVYRAARTSFAHQMDMPEALNERPTSD